jgi:hypothetical protein
MPVASERWKQEALLHSRSTGEKKDAYRKFFGTDVTVQSGFQQHHLHRTRTAAFQRARAAAGRGDMGIAALVHG